MFGGKYVDFTVLFFWSVSYFQGLNLDSRKFAVKSFNLAVFYSRFGGEPRNSSGTHGLSGVDFPRID